MNLAKKAWRKDLQLAMIKLRNARLLTRKVLTEDDDYEFFADELGHAQEHIFFVLDKTSESDDAHK